MILLAFAYIFACESIPKPPILFNMHTNYQKFAFVKITKSNRTPISYYISIFIEAIIHANSHRGIHRISFYLFQNSRESIQNMNRFLPAKFLPQEKKGEFSNLSKKISKKIQKQSNISIF